MSPAEARLREVPSNMTEAEWQQRVNLAACYRLVALYGWDDLVDTHISARVPCFQPRQGRPARQPALRERIQHQPGRLHHPFGDSRGA
jgi:ribulose-5-phosphate 4-epimerase/fuculose-1-phosphate aldolase